MPLDGRIIAITGAAGFIGQNLAVRLRELGLTPCEITRDMPSAEAAEALSRSDLIFHLAGANRPEDPAEFMRSNRDYAKWVAERIAEGGRRPLLICSSTAKAEEESEYGRSKRAGEAALLELGARDAATVAIYRLPGVFGKWARPNYNSVVATFCHNIARGLPIRIDDAATQISLLYVDDLIDQWLCLADNPLKTSGYVTPGAIHQVTLGDLAEMIRAFASGRESGEIAAVGSGFAHALYATFVSALPVESFCYALTAHADPRGSFAEVLRTPDCGQMSFFSAFPGQTRGGHYHHSKVEKFVVVHGEALFRFRHIVSGAIHEVRASAAEPSVVESIPGWSHDVTNSGTGTMVALVWASEVFDRERPDTIAMPV
jgi:UDP-2-acetamido-2,6-beta-L-arabino-hexul-4-ose reductase